MIAGQELDDLRAAVNGSVLAHVCTLRQPQAGTDDAWGDATVASYVETPNVPCLYRAREEVVGPDVRGLVVLERPSLLLQHDTPAREGWRVRDVRDQAAGVVLLDGGAAGAEIVTVEPVPGVRALLVSAGLRAAEIG